MTLLRFVHLEALTTDSQARIFFGAVLSGVCVCVYKYTNIYIYICTYLFIYLSTHIVIMVNYHEQKCSEYLEKPDSTKEF